MEKPSKITRLKKAVYNSLTSDKLSEGEADNNLAWNKKRWGKKGLWEGKDRYGYQWGGGHKQEYSGIVRIAEQFLLPHVGDRRDYHVVEIAPGAGRMTTEFVRIAKTMTLVDLNQACIDICRERFKYYDNFEFHVNDGKSLTMIGDESKDIVVSYDALVHVVPELIREYMVDIKRVLKPEGMAWLDHSGKGRREAGRRTSMTAERMREFADELGFEIIAQHFRNDHDVISILKKPS